MGAGGGDNIIKMSLGGRGVIINNACFEEAFWGGRRGGNPLNKYFI